MRTSPCQRTECKCNGNGSQRGLHTLNTRSVTMRRPRRTCYYLLQHRTCYYLLPHCTCYYLLPHYTCLQ